MRQKLKDFWFYSPLHGDLMGRGTDIEDAVRRVFGQDAPDQKPPYVLDRRGNRVPVSGGMLLPEGWNGELPERFQPRNGLVIGDRVSWIQESRTILVSSTRFRIRARQGVVRDFDGRDAIVTGIGIRRTRIPVEFLRPIEA